MAGSGPIHLMVLLGAVALIAPHLQQTSKPERPASVDEDVSTAIEGAGANSGKIELQRAGDGHFYADARVNGVAVRFLIDTGASAIVLTAEDARRASLGAGEAQVSARGAGGEIRLRQVSLARLSLGGSVHDNVPALAAEAGDLPVSLLGQNFLARFRSVTIEGDRMSLQ